MAAPYPHCNSDTIHAPGDCYYCDKYPDLQLLRRAEGRPYSPGEANGWSGNVAVKKGETHSHMGATFVVGSGEPDIDYDTPCTVNFKRGWRCVLTWHGSGPCALVPTWWNLRDRWRYR